MLLSKCRTCGNRHRLGPCPDSGRPTDKAMAREPVDEATCKSSLQVQTAGASGDLPPPSKASRDGKRVVEPLTPAEKQKAYRERHADEVRKRDRERKAAKRQEAKDD